jgi:hypothetical protein
LFPWPFGYSSKAHFARFEGIAGDPQIQVVAKPVAVIARDIRIELWLPVRGFLDASVKLHVMPLANAAHHLQELRPVGLMQTESRQVRHLTSRHVFLACTQRQHRSDRDD